MTNPTSDGMSGNTYKKICLSILGNTVEPLKEDPPRKGHCIKYLSTMDETKSPNLSLPINIMRLEPLRRGQPL